MTRTLTSINYEIERLEQQLEETESGDQREYIKEKLRELYATLGSNGADLS